MVSAPKNNNNAASPDAMPYRGGAAAGADDRLKPGLSASPCPGPCLKHARHAKGERRGPFSTQNETGREEGGAGWHWAGTLIHQTHTDWVAAPQSRMRQRQVAVPMIGCNRDERRRPGRGPAGWVAARLARSRTGTTTTRMHTRCRRCHRDRGAGRRTHASPTLVALGVAAGPPRERTRRSHPCGAVGARRHTQRTHRTRCCGRAAHRNSCRGTRRRRRRRRCAQWNAGARLQAVRRSQSYRDGRHCHCRYHRRHS